MSDRITHQVNIKIRPREDNANSCKKPMVPRTYIRIRLKVVKLNVAHENHACKDKLVDQNKQYPFE